MSLILEGIDMPIEVNGTKLTLELYVRSDGVVFDDDFEEVGRAIQIPKNHGRLIDADKIDYDEFWHREGQGFTIAVCQGAEQIIKEQPTILEAEGEDVHKSNV